MVAQHLTYEVIEHDGGWAYKVGDVISETFRDHESAHRAATRAADEHRRAGNTEFIEYEDKDGKWHEERADGHDRPETDVKD